MFQYKVRKNNELPILKIGLEKTRNFYFTLEFLAVDRISILSIEISWCLERVEKRN